MNRLEELTLKLLDQTISEDEVEELIALAATEERRECAVKLMLLESELLCSGRNSIADPVIDQIEHERRDRVEARVMRAVTGTNPSAQRPSVATARRTYSRFAVACAGIAAVAACIAFAIIPLGRLSDVEEVVATVSARGVSMTILDGDGKERAWEAGGELHQLRLNETIVTSSAVDSVEILYADGTELELLGETRVRFTRTVAGAKELDIQSGLVKANVALQPTGRPLRIVTQAATLEVLGTTLGVEVKHASTQLGVATGRVVMTRKSDGKRVEVEAGRFATATESTNEPLKAHPFPDLPYEWTEDFGDGLPDGWRSGELVLQDESTKPVGHPLEQSIHAVRAIRREGGSFVVTSHNAWQEGIHGLCMLDDNSELHLRFRQSLATRITIMIGTRAYPPEKGQVGGNLFYTKKAWNEDLPAGSWRTITIPLQDVSWHVKRGERMKGPADLEGLAAYLIHVNTMQKDAGLVIDRMWITRGAEEEQ